MRLNSVTKFPRVVQIIEQNCIIIGTILLVETIALTWWNNPSTWDFQSFAIDTLAPILVLDTWFVFFIHWCWRTSSLPAMWLTITWAFWGFLWAMCVFSFATFESTWSFCECKLSIYFDPPQNFMCQMTLVFHYVKKVQVLVGKLSKAQQLHATIHVQKPTLNATIDAQNPKLNAIMHAQNPTLTRNNPCWKPNVQNPTTLTSNNPWPKPHT